MLTFKAFGVAIWIATNRPEVRVRLPEVLPPGWQDAQNEEVTHRLGLLGDDNGTYAVDLGGVYFLENVPLDLALETMDSVVRARVAEDAPDHIFVHAGAVAHAGKAILIPGRSFSGKTTLVAALVRAGAVYYSDEYAPLDTDGLVHPYAKPLSLRGEDQMQTDHSVESLGGTAGDKPLPVGLVVDTTYRPGSDWSPERLPPGRGALAVLSHTVPARKRPQQALQSITNAVEGATILQGDRGEADTIAHQLLAQLENQTT